MSFTIKDPKVRINKQWLKKVDKTLTAELQRKTIDKSKRAVGLGIRKAYKAAYRSVDRIFQTGVALAPGVKSIAYENPFGTSGRYKTQAWEALSPKYAAQAPRSTRFWMKHSGGGSYKHRTGSRIALSTLYAQARPGAPATRSTKRPKMVMDTRKNRTMTWDTIVQLPGNEAMREYIAQPLIEGITLASLPGGHPRLGTIKKDDISLIGWVEGRRPFLRGMSFSLGQKTAKGIRKAVRQA